MRLNSQTQDLLFKSFDFAFVAFCLNLQIVHYSIIVVEHIREAGFAFKEDTFVNADITLGFGEISADEFSEDFFHELVHFTISRSAFLKEN